MPHGFRIHDVLGASKKRQPPGPTVRGRPTVSSYEFLGALSQYLRFCADGSPEAVRPRCIFSRVRALRPDRTGLETRPHRGCGLGNSMRNSALIVSRFVFPCLRPCMQFESQILSFETVSEAATHLKKELAAYAF